MEISLAQLAGTVGGQVIGACDPDRRLTGTCALDSYVNDRIAFVRNAKFAPLAGGLENAVVLIPPGLDLPERYPQNTYVVVDDVDLAMAGLQELFYKEAAPATAGYISPRASIAASAVIGRGVLIADNALVGENTVIGEGAQVMHGACVGDGVVIGQRSCLHAYSTCERCQIGEDTIVHAGAHVGVDAFRFWQDWDRKKVVKMIHSGSVQIGDRVEVGAGDAIQISTFEGSPTIIGNDVKLGHNVVVGNNARIGARTIIACLVMIGGGNEIGEEVWIGASAFIANGVKIGKRVKVRANASVLKDIGEGEVIGTG